MAATECTRQRKRGQDGEERETETEKTNAHDRQSQTETMTTTTKARACPALLYCLPLTPSIKKDMSLTLLLAEETGLKGV